MPDIISKCINLLSDNVNPSERPKHKYESPMSKYQNELAKIQWSKSMTIVLQHKRLHSVIIFQVYYLNINIDSLSQYIWTLVEPHYIGLIRSYTIKYYIIIDIFAID